MVKAQDMTPEEAQQYLMEQQKRTLERQQEFGKKKQSEGYKRVTAWINSDAWEALQTIKNADEHATNASVMTQALIVYAESLKSPDIKPVKKREHQKKKSVNANKKTVDKYRFNLQVEATELKGAGLSNDAIAEKFKELGYKNGKGKVSWSRESIRRLLKA